MRKRLLEILACPACAGSLEVIEATRTDGPNWIEEGRMRCSACAREYPILHGVPILLMDGVSQRSSRISGRWSFDYQWRLKFKGKLEHGHWLWGKNLDQLSYRLRVENCWHLDCGSGSGDHTRRIAEQNPSVQVVGLDRSDSVLRTGPRDREVENLHYVRGNILRPPFRQSAFRTMMAVGSLHATGDTRAALTNCAGLLEPSGYLSTWLYPSLQDLETPLAKRPRWQGRGYSTGNGRTHEGGEYHMWKRYYLFRDRVFMGAGHRLPAPILFALCRAISVAISPFGHLLRLQVPDIVDRIRSNTFILYDDISPEHQDRPSKNEVFKWLRDAGCGQVTYSFRRGGVFTAMKTAPPPAH